MSSQTPVGFWHADHRRTISGDFIGVLFTDRTLDVADRAGSDTRTASIDLLHQTAGRPVTWMHQVHGRQVAVIDHPLAEGPTADALVTAGVSSALGARAADCVPVLLADLVSGAVAAVHAGRQGVAVNVVGAALDALADLNGSTGAERVVAWIGPHVCGSCYEVPDALRTEVADLVPLTHAVTSWGTPALDLGAGVTAQLTERGVAEVISVGGCTMEEPRLHSHRRDATAAGRLAGVVWRAPADDGPAGVEPRDLGKPEDSGKGESDD